MARLGAFLPQEQDKTDTESLRVLLGVLYPFDCARYVPSLCWSEQLSVVRRPPHFGRSVFLSTVAHSLDVLSPHPRKERWPSSVARVRRRPFFNFNSGVILYLDMGLLRYGSYEDSKAQIVSLVRIAVVQFLDKYQSYINLTEEQRTEALAENHLFPLLHYTMNLVTWAHPEAFTYICIDNCTSPFERAPQSDDWPRITEILDESLFCNLRGMVASGLIDSGVLVGSSEMDRDPMASLTCERAVKSVDANEWGDDFFTPDNAPMPIPFIGALMGYAADRTHSPDLQSAIGFTKEGVVALARAVLGDDPWADELWARVSKIPSRTFSHNPDAENVWAAGDVMEILCDMAGTRTTKDDLHFERPVGLVVS